MLRSATLTHLHPSLQDYVRPRLDEVAALSTSRKQALQALIEYARACRAKAEPIQLNFICTHNSRRSHLGQIWSQISASIFGVNQVSSFSGGTEATAFNPRAIAALRRAGLVIDVAAGSNPICLVSFAPAHEALRCFSKRFDDESNPTQGFAAIMTCDDADKNCPVIVGATRLSLPYRDPKEADDSPAEAERYDERCAQIATEMLYVFSEL